jgi:hypothetical protein
MLSVSGMLVGVKRVFVEDGYGNGKTLTPAIGRNLSSFVILGLDPRIHA